MKTGLGRSRPGYQIEEMDDRNPLYPPPGGGQLPPPPPIYQVTSAIPPSSQYHYSPAPPRRSNRGILGGLPPPASAAVACGNLVLLRAALIGFYINLFNLILLWQLDGSWILAPVSKWFMVGGYALLAVGALF